MDVLAVDQRDENQVIAVVENGPDIFLGAERTIAVREGDGFFDCCAEAIRNLHNLQETRSAIYNHIRDHRFYLLEEMYLKRFWTLEEILVSHTVQFTSCIDRENLTSVLTAASLMYKGPSEINEMSAKLAERNRSVYDNIYRDETRRIIDALNCLIMGFSLGAGEHTDRLMLAFIQAYVCCGIVTRTKSLATGAFADPLSPRFQDIFAYSERKSSKPRDYIFVSMAQQSWYCSPAGAKHMTFNEIFLDLDRQAKRAKGFACRITESMTGDCAFDGAWNPSSDLPEPICLGDFVLLLGNPVDQPPRADLPGPTHLVALAVMSNPEEALSDPSDGPDCLSETSDAFHGSSASPAENDEPSTRAYRNSAPFLDIIEAAMRFSHHTWKTSGRAGELSKHGSWPKSPLNERIYVWQDLLREKKSNTQGPNHPQKRINKELQKESSWTSDEHFVIEEALKSLSLMFGSISDQKPDAGPDWRHYVRSMKEQWPVQLLQMMLLIAAMVGCRLPLSAASWAKERFTPVLIWLDEHGKRVLGLLSKRRHHALVSQDSLEQSPVFLASRGRSDSNRGKDIVVLDPETKLPVGLVPDFSHRAMDSEEWKQRMTLLYGRLYA